MASIASRSSQSSSLPNTERSTTEPLTKVPKKQLCQASAAILERTKKMIQQENELSIRAKLRRCSPFEVNPVLHKTFALNLVMLRLSRTDGN